MCGMHSIAYQLNALLCTKVFEQSRQYPVLFHFLVLSIKTKGKRLPQHLLSLHFLSYILLIHITHYEYTSLVFILYYHFDDHKLPIIKYIKNCRKNIMKKSKTY